MIKILLKGIVMGVANIIPGVSGGTMAVSMGIYDKLIHCVTHLFKEFKESMKFLIPLFIGIAIALIGLSFVIEPAFEYFPLQTSCLFVGLIVGGLPAIYKKIKGKGVKVSYVLPCVIFFGVVVGMAVMGGQEGNSADLSFSLIAVIKLFVVGLIAAATMVIPGVSGSMMLLLLGYYNPIVAAIKDFVTALVSFDVPGILSGCGILVPAGLGMVAGVFAIAKVIEVIFEKFPMQAYWGIIGLIAASPFAVLMSVGIGSVSAVSVIVSVVTFVAGFVVALKLGD